MGSYVAACSCMRLHACYDSFNASSHFVDAVFGPLAHIHDEKRDGVGLGSASPFLAWFFLHVVLAPHVRALPHVYPNRGV